MLRIINPANGSLIKDVEEDSRETIREKYRRARAAQPAWARTPLETKLETIERFRDLIVRNTGELATTLTSEIGKPITQSRNELKGLLTRIDSFLQSTEETLSGVNVHEEDAIKEAISHEPLGVIGNISAWNYPYFVGSNVFVPALLTGNTVLYKPSEFATLTGLHVARMLHQAGVPEDAFIPVIGNGSAGAEMMDEPLNAVFFTGSYETGKKVASAAARHLMRVQLELGGKDPVYVCEDVDIKVAAEGLADGAFYNAGQSCCSVERIYVHEAIYQQFVESFVQTALGFTIGDPRDERTYIGPLARGAQIAVLEEQVRDALLKGARLLTGGKRMNVSGNYFEPTVFMDVSHSMRLMREESFGPIIGIQKVANDQEAIRLMNDTEYGLTAGVYTRDSIRAEKILKEVNSGSVYWNCCDRVSPRLPWTGRGHSGIGSTLSKQGILAFVQPKAWHLKKAG